MNIDEMLRPHDPARGVPPDLGRSPRAIATLTRITSTRAAVRPARPARRRAVRYAMAAVVASAGVVLAPVLGTGNAAVANWDAAAHPASPSETAHYAQECAAWTRVPLRATPGGYEVKVVEIRGTWVMTYLASADGEAQCLRSVSPAPNGDSDNESQSGPLASTPAPDGLATAGVLETSGLGDSGPQFMVAGKVGARVTGIVFTAQGLRVQATIRGGSFTAWWPRREPASLLGRLVDKAGYNGSPNPEVTITLNDGHTLRRHIRDYDVNH